MLPKRPVDVLRTGIDMEAENLRRYDLPVARRLWLYRQGFLSSRDAIYDLSEETVDAYLSDVQHLRTEGLNEPNTMALNNTALFQLVVSRTHAELLPTFHAILSADQGVTPVPGGDVETFDDLVALVRENPVVVKPLKQAGGTGVALLESDGQQLQFDGQPVSESELAEICSSGPDRMVVEYVEQAEYAREIYPGAANTIRVLTMIHPDTGEPFIAAAVHRFGWSNTGIVDNWSSGGLTAAFDTEDGTIGEAVASPKGGSVARMTHHPDTDTPISGATVPEWPQIRERLLDLAEEYRGLWSYVGWDIVVTDDEGGFALIEGNAFCDVDLLQVHEPLLADDRVRRFYEHHGVV
ncbi:sugar-transfer associated ATP-grasp domain-containing protein [Halobellus ordinarius]|uniref:sugar-transfer associated ATP-grasp domain-containing protein n=1 Tax=Halobellus ordinarius TaxID=3075120 RepID=UPI002880B8DC|nr:sugar-transfer associated ATP-grasp domain-containing protein [Halobellus sp. ZY16]